jgi:2-keto-3-deoxy-L-rhamnonate aldolase RhmA
VKLIEESDRETIVLAHVETCLGVENIDEILAQGARSLIGKFRAMGR